METIVGLLNAIGWICMIGFLDEVAEKKQLADKNTLRTIGITLVLSTGLILAFLQY